MLTVLMLLRHLFLWATNCYNKNPHDYVRAKRYDLQLTTKTWKDCLRRNGPAGSEDGGADLLCGDELMRNRWAWLLRQSRCVSADWAGRAQGAGPGNRQRDTQREDCITQIDKQNPQERIVLKIQTSGRFIHILQVNNSICSLNIKIFKLRFCEIMFIVTFW